MYIYITLQLLIKVDYPSIMTEIFYLYFIFPIFFFTGERIQNLLPPLIFLIQNYIYFVKWIRCSLIYLSFGFDRYWF